MFFKAFGLALWALFSQWVLEKTSMKGEFLMYTNFLQGELSYPCRKKGILNEGPRKKSFFVFQQKPVTIE